MRGRLATVWEALRASYWFIPALMSLGAIGLVAVMLRLDRRYGDELPSDVWWIYSGEDAGARAVLAEIVSSMISVTSVVFSITIVALTLAAGQYGSRLLRNFMRDRANQLTLGTFIATFIYALLALRTIRGGDDNAFVPPLTITLGVVLVIVSAGVLIFFIHHIASSIQADTILEQVGKELHHVIDRLYPEPLGHGPPPRVERPEAGLPPGFDDDTFPIHALRDDYLQTVDDERLMEIAREHDLVLRLRHRPGDFVVRGAVLADVWPARARDTKLIKALYRTFALGRYRSIEHDAEFGIDQIVEVATRALSTGINDPFTVTTAIDRLSGALSQLADRGFPERFRYDDEGSLRVVADTTSFSGFVDSAFNQIRQNANGSAAVLIRMLEAIERIAECVRTEEQRRSLREHARLVLEAGEEGIAAERDKRELRQRYDAATRALRAARAA